MNINNKKSVKAIYTTDDLKNKSIKTLRQEILDKGKKLNSFTLRNQNTSYINKQIYHLLLDPFTLDNAYTNLSKNKGAFTDGVNVGNIQGYSRSDNLKLINLLKEKKYYPNPVRRIWIPKPGKKVKRPLGIPTFYDKVIQEAIRGILEAIYEPEFREFEYKTKVCNNFGFRPNLNCWNAVEHYTTYGQKCTYTIEGDIKAAYDSVNITKLLDIISKRIKDKNFMNLLSRILHSGVMDEGKYIHSLIGVPQGGVLSPILFNIYMFEFDKFIYEGIISKYTQLTKPTHHNKSKAYQRILYKKNKALEDFTTEKNKQKIDGNKDKTLFYSKRKELLATSKQLLSTPSYDTPENHTFVYTRYADDWLLGVGGSENFTQQIKDEIQDWLTNNLYLTLSPEKTHITNIRKQFVPFLGYEILLRSDNRRIKITNIYNEKENKYIKRRTTSSKFYVKPNKERLINKVKLLGIVRPNDLYPIGKRPWSSLDEFQIVLKYHSIFLGLTGHYINCNSLSPLNRLSYIFLYSCAKTLAIRKKLTIRQIFNKYGKNLEIIKTFKDNPEKSRKISFMGLKLIKESYFNNLKPLTPNFDPFKIRTFWRTTFKLYSQCCICGVQENIEMHHIKSLKSIKNKTQNFNLILKQLNRKQIPVCHQCHVSITTGKYDSTKLNEFFSISLAAF